MDTAPNLSKTSQSLTEQVLEQKTEGFSFGFLAPTFVMLIAFYFLVIRPQDKKRQEIENAISKVKKGDKVIVGGGIVGYITKVGDVCGVEVAKNVEINVLRKNLEFPEKISENTKKV